MLVVLGAILGASTTHAQYAGQLALGLGGDVMFPAESAITLGFGVIGSIDYYLSHRWSTGLSFGFHKASESPMKLDVSSLVLNIGVHFDLGEWHPLFEGGIGIFHVKERTHKSGPVHKDTAPGILFGFGVEYFYKPNMSFRIHIRAHDVFTDLNAAFFSFGVTGRFYF